MTAEIIYNTSVIASLDEEQSATIKCAGKNMLTDLEIVFNSRGRVSYGDKVIEANSGQTVTLLCNGNKLTEDVIVYTPNTTYQPLITSDNLQFTTSDDEIFMVKE